VNEIRVCLRVFGDLADTYVSFLFLLQIPARILTTCELKKLDSEENDTGVSFLNGVDYKDTQSERDINNSS
jgi:hypothetical protein